MSIPNHFATIQRVSDAHPHLIATNRKDEMTELLWRCAVALHAEDPNFGLLSKSSGENHTVIDGQMVAVDAIAYRGSDEIVDIFRSAHDGPGEGGLSWSVDHRRPSNKWIAPPAFPGGQQPEPEPEPDPGEPTDPGEPVDDARLFAALDRYFKSRRFNVTLS